MAALTLEAARRARQDAERLRTESQVLRFLVRRQVGLAHTRLAGARDASRARERHAAPVPSPWSELSWVSHDASLDQTLVPVD